MYVRTYATHEYSSFHGSKLLRRANKQRKDVRMGDVRYTTVLITSFV